MHFTIFYRKIAVLTNTVESVYNTHRKFEGRFQGEKVRIIHG